MSKKIEDASVQFGFQLDRYINHFGLTRTDIGYLLSTPVSNIDKIIAGEKGIVLKTVEKLSGFFGIAYFEMGNPEFPLPEVQDLPLETQRVILARKSNDISERDYDLQFTKCVRLIVESNYLQKPRTAKQVFNKLPKEIKSNEKYESRRVTDSFKNGSLQKFVVEVGKRGKESLFQLIQFVKDDDKL